MKLDIIDEVTVHQCELKVGYTCTHVLLYESVVLMKVAKKYAGGVIQWFRSVNEYLYL